MPQVSSIHLITPSLHLSHGFLFPAPRERHRHEIIEQSISPVPAADHMVATQVPGVNCVLPGAMRGSPISADENSLPICHGYGPGIMPPFLYGSRQWWEGVPGARPLQLWEIYACPIQNPTEFYKNPLRCLINENEGLLATFAEAFLDPDFILGLVKSIGGPLAAELFWALTPFPLIERVISTVCSIAGIVEDVANSLSGATDAVGGFFSDAASTISSWFRRLTDENGTTTLETCTSGCGAPGYGCWRPMPTALGICVNQTAFAAVDLTIPTLIRLYSILLSIQVQGVSQQVDGIDRLVESINFTVNTVDGYFDPTVAPTAFPTLQPTANPTLDPTSKPSLRPTFEPSTHPTLDPTATPSVHPTSTPSSPTLRPSFEPSNTPTQLPTETPSMPTVFPTQNPTEAPSDTTRRTLESISESDLQTLAEQVKKMANEVGEGKMDSFGESLVSSLNTPELRQFISKQLDEASNSLEKLTLDPEHPTHKLIQMVVQKTFDTETGTFNKEKAHELKEITRRMEAVDIFGPLQGQKGQGTLNIERRKAEAIQRNTAARESRNNEISLMETPYGFSAKAASPSRSPTHSPTVYSRCPAATTDGMVDQVCDWVHDGIAEVKQSIADFITGLVEKGVNLASNVAHSDGVCLSGGISIITEMLSFMDPFAPNGPALPRIILGALVDIFQAFLVQLLFGSCRDYCTSDQFNADPFCCLPSKSPAFRPVESLTDPDLVYLSNGCDKNFESELHIVKGLLEMVDPLLEAGADGVIAFVNFPIVIVRGMLKVLNSLMSHLDEVCGTLGNAIDSASTTGAYYNTKFILDNTICRPTSTDSPTGRQGYGCDGIDNNCNYIVDECDEDHSFPEFFMVDSHSPDNWYKSTQEVYAHFNNNLRAKDDCAISLPTQGGDIVGNCASSSLTYAAVDKCENSNSVTMNFKLDRAAPSISCSVDNVNLGLAKDDEVCTQANEGWCDKRYVNVGLHYDVTDDCGIESVSLKVFSDELASPSDAYFVQSGGKYQLIVNEENVFSDTCPLCVGNQLPDGRVYEVQITAVDISGRITTQNCPLIRVRGESAQQQAQVPIDSGYRVLVSSHDSIHLPECVATSHDSTISRRGFGCDGIDNNCDTDIDDCQEDTFAPEFALTTTVSPTTWFTSHSQASNYVSQMVSASDDCYAVTPIMKDFTGTCASTNVPFSVTDACGNSNSLTIPIKLDLAPPTIQCGVDYQDIGWQTDQPKKGKGRFRCGVGDVDPCDSDFIDVGFNYFFSDDCGVVSATFEIYSDEMVDDKDILFYLSPESNFYHLVVNQKKVYDPQPKKCDKCVGGQAPDGRVYEVIITIEDVAGNTVTQKCPLITVRSSVGGPQQPPFVVVDSGFRFLALKTLPLLSPPSTAFPTSAPSTNPSVNPSVNPTNSPTFNPSVNPSTNPTLSPSVAPSSSPTLNPTVNPTCNPSVNPTTTPPVGPPFNPTLNPSPRPSTNPSLAPSPTPSLRPTVAPTANTGTTESPTLGFVRPTNAPTRF
jgi:hypothetical protein